MVRLMLPHSSGQLRRQQLILSGKPERSASDLKTVLGAFLTSTSTRAALHHAQVTFLLEIIPAIPWCQVEATLREKGEWTAWHDTCIELHAVQDAIAIDQLGAMAIARFCAEKIKALSKGDNERHLAEEVFRGILAEAEASTKCKVSGQVR